MRDETKNNDDNDHIYSTFENMDSSRITYRGFRLHVTSNFCFYQMDRSIKSR